MPPLIGWAAARGRLDSSAWVLFAIVFLWQFPHFVAIAWMYREDYSRAGYFVLPAMEASFSAIASALPDECLPVPARRLFACILYLPVLFGWLALDKK